MDKTKALWKYLNEELGIYTIEEAIEFDKKLVLDIGILGCTKEELDKLREDLKKKTKEE